MHVLSTRNRLGKSDGILQKRGERRLDGREDEDQTESKRKLIACEGKTLPVDQKEEIGILTEYKRPTSEERRHLYKTKKESY